MKFQVNERYLSRLQIRRCRCVVLMAIAIAIVGPGCTSRRLQSSTAKQAQTVVDLEYQQILDNLAMFSLNHDAMPSMAMLKTGATQVGDTGSIGFVGTAGLATRFGSSPTFSGTRTIVDQWGSSPLTDDNNLMLVRKAFRCALGDKDLLNEEDANDLAHDLSAQIGTTSDMSVDQDTLGRIYTQNLISNAVGSPASPKSDGTSTPSGILNKESPRDPKEEQAEKDKLYKLSRRLALAREIIGKDLTDTLDQVILAKNYYIDKKYKLDFISWYGYMPNNFLSENKIQGELVRDSLVVAEDKEKILVRLCNHTGKIVYSDTIDSKSPIYDQLHAQVKAWQPDNGLADDDREILKAVVELLSLKGILKERFEPLRDTATGLAKEAIYRVNDAQKTLDEINPGWFRCGPEKPRDACYVGHATFCGQECYVWVCRDGLNDLEEFTRKVLKLGTTLKDVQVVTAPSGIQFAPALSNPGR